MRKQQQKKFEENPLLLFLSNWRMLLYRCILHINSFCDSGLVRANPLKPGPRRRNLSKYRMTCSAKLWMFSGLSGLMSDPTLPQCSFMHFITVHHLWKLWYELHSAWLSLCSACRLASRVEPNGSSVNWLLFHTHVVVVVVSGMSAAFVKFGRVFYTICFSHIQIIVQSNRRLIDDKKKQLDAIVSIFPL